ncbi:hypothetical protein NQ314_010207 [Rhamnusium bicolor]|uniref:Peptidase S1 domain-containing protein n=1 Tax=Rhamnusium bicolor TaxID=1586634 RepID=A0AAV8XTI1_9CUCU|nr:hypothetical protein NQ314_010207 [Rhamnusium bicolor]
MKGVILLLALLGVAWAYPQGNIDDFPMRRMYVDVKDYKPPGLETRIINGQEVIPHSIPYQVWLLFRSSPSSTSGWTCGGTLITRRFVLTAAHCISGSSTISNDIGVIELEELIEINEFVNVAPLPRLADLDNLYEAENVRVSGWGLTTGGGSRSDVLLAVNSTVLPNAQCRSVFNIFEETEICISGEGGVGACNGDSGGPLTAGNTQVGIVSYGRTGCLAGYPSVFVRITSFSLLD